MLQQAPDLIQLSWGAPRAATGDQGLMPRVPTLSNPGEGMPGLLGFGGLLRMGARGKWSPTARGWA